MFETRGGTRGRPVSPLAEPRLSSPCKAPFDPPNGFLKGMVWKVHKQEGSSFDSFLPCRVLFFSEAVMAEGPEPTRKAPGTWDRLKEPPTRTKIRNCQGQGPVFCSPPFPSASFFFSFSSFFFFQSAYSRLSAESLGRGTNQIRSQER